MMNHTGLALSVTITIIQHVQRFDKEDTLNCFLTVLIEETPLVIHDYIIPQTPQERAGLMYESYCCAD